MPYCTNCGSPVAPIDRFCTRCGTPLNNQLPPPPTNSTYFIGLSTKKDFSLGIQVGACAAIVIMGSLILSALNAMYWTQWSQLQHYGVSAQNAHYLLFNLAAGMGLCAFVVIYAAYFLFHAFFIQLNPTMRVLMSNGLNRARAGIGLVAGGVYSFAFSAMQYYMFIGDDGFQSFGWLQLPIVFAAISLIVASTGLAVLANAYLKSRKQATKV